MLLSPTTTSDEQKTGEKQTIMTLEQCIAKYTTVPGVPNTGLASESTQHLLVYALAIGLTIFAIGIIFWKYSTRHSTKNSTLSNSLNRTSP